MVDLLHTGYQGRADDAPQVCTRYFPHICGVNGSCNGWAREVPDDTDELKSDAWRDVD
jgi:hypothetical protein